MDRTGIVVPDGEEYDTIAGFVTDRLDRMPELGDEVETDDGGVLRVERVVGTHVERLRFTPALGDSPLSPHDRIVESLTKELSHE